MDVLKQGAQNLKSIGFGAAMPEERDRLLGMVTGETNKTQDEKIKALEAEVAAGKKTKEQDEEDRQKLMTRKERRKQQKPWKKQGHSESEEIDGHRFWAVAGANPNYSKIHMFDP